MMKTISTLACILLISTTQLAGCKRGAEPAAPATIARAPSASTAIPAPPAVTAPSEPQPDWSALLAELGPPSLMMVRSVNDRCEWSVLEPPAFEPRLIMTTRTCPPKLAWDRRGGRSLFTIDGVIYLHDWQAARVQQLAPSPVEDAQPDLGFSSAGQPRICSGESRPVPGRESEDVAQSYLIRFEPRGPDGAWLKVAEEAIDYDLGQDTCAGGDDLENTGSVYYNPRAVVPANCTDPDKPNPDEVCPTAAAIAAVRRQVTVANDGIEYLTFGPTSFLGYSYQFGDSVHPQTPLFSIEQEVVTPILSFAEPAGIAIRLGIDHFLVETAEAQYLFKKGEQKPLKVVPEGARVMWIPGTMPESPVIEVGR